MNKIEKQSLRDINDLKKVCKKPNLVHSEGMSEVEISLALGISYNSTKNTLAKACSKLELIFKEKGFKEDLEEYLNKYYCKEDI